MGLSNLKSKFMTRNACFTVRRKITPTGIMVHFTVMTGVMAADWFNRWNKSYKAGIFFSIQLERNSSSYGWRMTF